ncbi:unnamed protein product [Bodo saltans]|uniref:Uncharacterized protein n=1 Tax=Bodo saltans TaxID=75058 RepID=A0A0S4JL94_BODSA|nr:unnamed protein product [Bodo saltans]|eukprot:CUG90009.1 unnamed protein product [Bodo saltans]
MKENGHFAMQTGTTSFCFRTTGAAPQAARTSPERSAAPRSSRRPRWRSSAPSRSSTSRTGVAVVRQRLWAACHSLNVRSNQLTKAIAQRVHRCRSRHVARPALLTHSSHPLRLLFPVAAAHNDAAALHRIRASRADEHTRKLRLAAAARRAAERHLPLLASGSSLSTSSLHGVAGVMAASRRPSHRAAECSCRHGREHSAMRCRPCAASWRRSRSSASLSAWQGGRAGGAQCPGQPSATATSLGRSISRMRRCATLRRVHFGSLTRTWQAAPHTLRGIKLVSFDYLKEGTNKCYNVQAKGGK